MNNLLEMVESHMAIYKTAFEEGRKVGDLEGYRRGILEARAIVEKTIGAYSPKGASNGQ